MSRYLDHGFMLILRMYLVFGLLAHKVVWEILKRGRPAAQPKSDAPLELRLVKAAKVAVLIGIVVQAATFSAVFPLAADPRPLRAAGVILFTAGLLTAIFGRLQLGSNWSDIEAPQVAGKQELVSRGLYQYIRHPIYAGDLVLLLGLELALNSWLVLGVVVLIPLVFRRVIAEEKLLATRLAGYDNYAQRTKRFIPYVV